MGGPGEGPGGTLAASAVACRGRCGCRGRRTNQKSATVRGLITAPTARANGRTTHNERNGATSRHDPITGLVGHRCRQNRPIRPTRRRPNPPVRSRIPYPKQPVRPAARGQDTGRLWRFAEEIGCSHKVASGAVAFQCTRARRLITHQVVKDRAAPNRRDVLCGPAKVLVVAAGQADLHTVFGLCGDAAIGHSDCSGLINVSRPTVTANSSVRQCSAMRTSRYA